MAKLRQMGECDVSGLHVHCGIPYSLLHLPMLIGFAFINYCLVMRNIKVQ